MPTGESLLRDWHEGASLPEIVPPLANSASGTVEADFSEKKTRIERLSLSTRVSGFSSLFSL